MFTIKEIISNWKTHLNTSIEVKGWIENKRVQNKEKLFFITLRDGSSLLLLQIICNKDNQNIDKDSFHLFKNILKRGDSVSIFGKIIESPAKGQDIELSFESGKLIGKCNISYPLSKARLPIETLRDYPHLRMRTKTFQAIFTIRNSLSYATHKFFQENKFKYINTPIISSNDCEGAGETFNVSNMLGNTTFFKNKANLTVSGQIHLEPFACSIGNVYTFGPTFRAENSNTTRHLAEFWMLEPELCFINFENLIDNMDNYFKYCLNYILENNNEELKFFDRFFQLGILSYLESISKLQFKRVTYDECIKILKEKTDFKIEWGDDLGSEMEKFLVEELGNNPIFVINYPKKLKSFYMKSIKELPEDKIKDKESDSNETDNSEPKNEKLPLKEKVEAVDMLVPKIGELMGGSMREDIYEVLIENMKSKNVKEEGLEWYTDLRRYGTVPHGGYGVGFERLIQFVTGIKNIRDVIPYPRYPGHCFA